MKHRDRRLRGALVVLLVVILALVAGGWHLASLRAQPLFTSAPTTAQLYLGRGQAVTTVFTITNGSSLARTISASFAGVPAGLHPALQSSVSVPAQASIAVPVLVAAETGAPLGQFVILVAFQGLAGDGSVLVASSALSVNVGVPAPTAAPSLSPSPWIYPGSPTVTPRITAQATFTPIELRDRSYLPYAAQPPRQAPAPAPTARTTPTGAPVPAPTAPTQAPGPVAVTIRDIFLRDPIAPDDTAEFVEIENISRSPVDISGWRLLNASRPGAVPAYVFPSFTLDADTIIVVYSEVGNDDLAYGEFFWDRPGDIWRVGDRAELRDSRNNLISILLVPRQ